MLSILRTNKYGDHCYIPSSAKEAQGKTKISGLPEHNEYWTIQQPTVQLKNHYKDTGCELRIYGNKEFLVSTTASKVISKNTSGSDGLGSSGILSFEHDSTRYFIFVVDNKNYLQNPQGKRNTGETGIQNIKREIKEELGVDVLDNQCKPGGYWKYTMTNNLIGYTKFSIHNDFFYVNVEYSQVSHLITQNLCKDELNIFNASDYSFVLDETQYVIIASEKMVLEHPDVVTLVKDGKYLEHKWDGHHREIILRKLGNTKYDIGYFNFSFV